MRSICFLFFMATKHQSNSSVISSESAFKFSINSNIYSPSDNSIADARLTTVFILLAFSL